MSIKEAVEMIASALEFKGEINVSFQCSNIILQLNPISPIQRNGMHFKVLYNVIGTHTHARILSIKM